MNAYDYESGGLNYTQITELYGTDKYNLSPRFQHYCYSYPTTLPKSDDVTWLPYVATPIYILDMEREKEINVGPSWSFPDLSAGECVLDSTW